MSESALSTFANGVSTYLINSIFPALVRGLTEKGINITTDELIEMTKVPVVKSTISVPPMTFNGNTTRTSSLIPNARAKHSGVTCSYVFQRGINEGQMCPKTAAAGLSYCTAHNPQKQPKPKPAAVVPGIAPGAIPVPQLNTIPITPSLDVTEYDSSRGLYREYNHGFIVSQENGNVPTVLGIVPTLGAQIRQLTEQERVVAEGLGLKFRTEQSEEIKTRVNEQEEETQEQVAEVPQFSTLKPAVSQSVPSFTIPSIPSLKQMPTSQQFSGIPSIRPIPTLSG